MNPWMPWAVLITVLILGAIFINPLKIWIQFQVLEVPVSFSTVLQLRSTNSDYKSLLNQYIIIRKVGLEIGLEEIALHSRKGGNVQKVVVAAVNGYKGDVPYQVQDLMALDLAGEDVVETMIQAVQSGVRSVEGRGDRN